MPSTHDESQSASPANILVVDDTRDNQIIIRAALSSLGHRVHLASSGREALELVARHRFAVILLDVVMPEMDGFEVARRIRSMQTMESTPILFITALQPDEQEIREGYEIGAVDFLFKPLNIAQIRAKASFFVELYRKNLTIHEQDEQLRRQEVEAMAHRGVEQLKLVTDSLPVLISYVDRGERYTFVNLAYEDWMGRPRPEIVGRSIREALGVEQYGQHAPRIQAALRGEPQSFENHVFHQRLGQRSALINYIPDRGEDGAVRGFVTLITDMTEIKAAEVALQRSSAELERLVAARTAELSKSRQFLNSVVENIPNMVFVKDAREFRFVRLNRAGEHLLGIRAEEILGKSDRDFFPPSQADHFVDHDRKVLESGRIEDIPEEPIATRNGHRFLHTKKLAIYDENGEPEYLLGISEDITDRKAAEEKLRRSQEELRVSHAELERRVQERTARLEELNRRLADAEERSRFLADAGALLASSTDHELILRDLAALAVPRFADWCFIDLIEEGNASRTVAIAHPDPELARAAFETLGRHSHPQTDKPGIGQVLCSGRAQLFKEIDDAVIEVVSQNESHAAQMRKYRFRSAMVVPMIAHGRVLGAITFATSESAHVYDAEELLFVEDLGRRAGLAVDNARLYSEAQSRSAALEKAVHARDEFLSIASHELKTPLTPLKLQLQGLRRYLHQNDVRDLKRELLDRIVHTSDKQIGRLTSLIEDLLDVSRITAGRLTLNREHVDLTELVHDAVERYSTQIQSASCQVRVHAQGPVTGSFDRLRLEQVVINLLTNAIKYAPGKPIDIEVSSRDGHACIRVRDQGMGIAPENLARIFGRFERLGSSGNVGGLGLGLYITHQIVETHGGRIHAESELGKGATFVVDLPLEAQALEEAPRPAAH